LRIIQTDGVATSTRTGINSDFEKARSPHSASLLIEKHWAQEESLVVYQEVIQKGKSNFAIFKGVFMLLELLQGRRSVRQFQAKAVEQEKVDYLVEAVLRSPSSRSLNPWEFVVVDDEKTLQALARAKTHGAAFVKNAPLAIVVCADPEKCDVWVEDCSIASIILHLAATELGLGSCWVQIRLRQHENGLPASAFVADLLGLRQGMEVEAVVAFGYPAEEKTGHGRDTLLWERISYNRYGDKR